MQARTGTSQQQRELQTLLMDTFQVDYRSSEDLLAYVYQYYCKIFYYNEENQRDGYWDQVFESSNHFYLTRIISYDFTELQDITLSDDDLKAKIQESNQMVMQWMTDLQSLEEYEFANKIGSLLNDDLFSRQIEMNDPEQNIVNSFISDTNEKKNSKLFSTQIHTSNETNSELENLRNIYIKLISYITKMARRYLEDSIQQKNDMRPDIGLLITFLELYKNAQNGINTISKRHLDFYYSDVLKINLAPGIETSTVVVFQLLPNISSAFLDQGTLLTAGKLFGSEVDILFQTSKAIQLLDTSLSEVKTLFFSKNKYIDTNTLNKLVSNINLTTLTIDAGAISSPSHPTPSIFGANSDEVINPEINPNEIAAMGFLIGSPVLYLSEGNREIEVIFTFEAESADTLWTMLDEIQVETKNNFDIVFEEILDPAFLISYTTLTGWVAFSGYRTKYNREANQIIILLNLGPVDPAVDQFTDDTAMSWPSLRVELNPYAPTYAYSFLAGLKMDTAEIKVSVSGVKDISIYSNSGMIPPAKAFDLFGPIPQLYNYFMFAKAELFKKQVKEIDVQIRWSYVPPDYGGFDTYYRAYSTSFTNKSFWVQPTVFSGGTWFPLNPKYAPAELLFDTVPCTTPEGFASVQLSWTKTLRIDNFDTLGVSSDFSLQDPILYSPQSQSGFIRFTLTEPVQAFGAQDYVNDYTAVALYNATNDPKIPYPNPPFVPNVADFTISYQAYDILNFDIALAGNNNSTVNTGEFKQITPFGLTDILYKKELSTEPFLLPTYEQQGYLILSFQTVQFPAVISAFFYLKSSGAQPTTQQYQLIWEYQLGQSWYPVPSGNILNDGTQNFIKSGIIEILLPNNGNKIDETYNIRVSSNGLPETFPNLAGIYLNSVQSICTSEDPNVIGKVVPAGSITALSVLNPNIASVSQPIDSQNGRLVEKEFYQRVRERLRHKQRAVSLWDYEHLVLQEFPDVAVVKCTNLDKNFKPQANNIRLVVMSKYWTFANQLSLNLEELASITDFVKNLSNPFCKVITMNPVSELLLVNCLVTFDPEDIGGYYLEKLNQEIINFLSPASTANGGILGIGKSVVPQMLTGYLEKLSYIKSVDKLYIEQIVSKGNATYSLGVFSDGSLITCTTDWSILMPAKQHNIVLKSNASEFKTKVGISSMELGTDFILGKEILSLRHERIDIDTDKNDRLQDNTVNAVLFINDNYLYDE